MNYTRTPVSMSLAVSLAEAKEHLRVTYAAEDALITGMIKSATNEIEAQTDIALIDQTITTTTDQWPGEIIALPVGPVASDATATIELIELDGSTTPVTSGFWIEGGRYPRLHFTTTPGGRLRISYPAGFGDDSTALPADLALGIKDQVARYFDGRGSEDEGVSLSPHTARVIARHRRVAI